MATSLDGQDVVTNVMSGSSDEIPFRIELLTPLEERGLRVGHSPSVHEDMMEGGPMDVDYGLMADQAGRLISALADAVSVPITTPGGSDIGMPGGVNQSTTHVDYLVHRPTTVARFADSSQLPIVADGDLVV